MRYLDDRTIPIDADTFASTANGVEFFRKGVHIGTVDASELVRIEHVE